MKLSRTTAIFEFSSPNGYASFNLNFECRNIYVIDAGDENQSHFSYLDFLPYWNQSSIDIICDDRGYEEWSSTEFGCSAAFQGEKCSMIQLVSILIPIE